MKDLDMLLNESAAGGDMFACQFNKVSNMGFIVFMCR